jgi:hypothetical protein
MSKYLYTLDLMELQEARLDRGDTGQAGNINFSMEREWGGTR